MTELVRERGVAGVTVAHIVGRSGVSRRTFYEQFADREDCLLAAFEHAVGCAAAVVLPAYRGGGSWEARIRAGLAALLEFLDVEPAMGGLCVVDALGADRKVLARRARILDALVDAVHEGARGSRSGSAREREREGEAADAVRQRSGAAHQRSGPARGASLGAAGRVVAEGCVGAVFGVIHARMLEQDAPRLGGLVSQLTSMIVLPYRGVAAGARELARPVPRGRRPVVAARGDPLRDLDMRLTYRTVRVLLAIAERPGACSREVADAAGVSDQGQISKLLWRLEQLGLIANGVQRHGHGARNAWSLTPRGLGIEHTIRTQTATKHTH